MKKLLLAVAGLALATNAYATNLTWGIPHRVFTTSTTVRVPPIMGDITMTVNPEDSSGVPLKSSSYGLLTDDGNRDRDFPLLTQLFSGQQLVGGATFSMTTAVPSLQYTRAAIMLTWASTAADTDSVRIAVRVYGTTSSTSGNWHLWTPLAVYTAGDTCETSGQVDADSLATGRCLRPISFWVGRTPSTRLGMPAQNYTYIHGAATWYIDGTLTTATSKMVKIRKVPISCLRWASANGVMLNLTDNTGAPCPFPYIRIEVTNLTRASTLTNIEANLWPRVQ